MWSGSRVLGVGRPAAAAPNYLVSDKAYSSRADRAGLRVERIPTPPPSATTSGRAVGVVAEADGRSGAIRSDIDVGIRWSAVPGASSVGGSDPLRQVQVPR